MSKISLKFPRDQWVKVSVAFNILQEIIKYMHWIFKEIVACEAMLIIPYAEFI